MGADQSKQATKRQSKFEDAAFKQQAAAATTAAVPEPPKSKRASRASLAEKGLPAFQTPFKSVIDLPFNAAAFPTVPKSVCAMPLHLGFRNDNIGFFVVTQDPIYTEAQMKELIAHLGLCDSRFILPQNN